MVDKVLEDILIGSNKHALPPNLMVIAGFASAKTSISIHTILKLLQEMHNSLVPGTETFEWSIIEQLLEGNLYKVKVLLIDLKSHCQRQPAQLRNTYSHFVEKEAEIEDEIPDLGRQKSQILRPVTSKVTQNEENEEFMLCSLCEYSHFVEKEAEIEDEIPDLGRQKSQILRPVTSKVTQKEENEEFMLCSLCKDSFLPIDAPLCHMFHISCLSEYIQKLLDARKFPLMCPFVGCSLELQMNELKTILDDQIYKACEELSFETFMESQRFDFKQCPNCEELFELTVAVDRFQCPRCRQIVCFKCKSLDHSPSTCEEYQLSLRRVFKCKGCGGHLELSVGSNTLYCTCGYMKIIS